MWQISIKKFIYETWLWFYFLNKYINTFELHLTGENKWILRLHQLRTKDRTKSNCYLTVLTIGSRVPLRRRQIGTEDGVVEDVEIRRHAVVTFIIVQNLNTSTLLVCQCFELCETVGCIGPVKIPPYLSRPANCYFSNHWRYFFPKRCRNWLLNVSDCYAAVSVSERSIGDRGHIELLLFQQHNEVKDTVTVSTEEGGTIDWNSDSGWFE